MQPDPFENTLSIASLSKHESEGDDETGLFCQSLAKRLRRLSPYQRAVAQNKILQAVTDIEFGVTTISTANSG